MQTPKKKPRALYKNLTWMFKLGKLAEHPSEVVVHMCLCPTSNIPTDMCGWWGKLLKTGGKAQWAELQFLTDIQSTGITASFLHSLNF
jgi:hypothetical protein